jgi:hypothetical protein
MEQAGYLDSACANADDPAKCKEDGLKAHREKRKEVLGF